MSIKTKIKSDLWRINYIIPFTVKYLQGGKWNYVKNALPVIAELKVVKSKGKRDIATDTKVLFEKIELHRDRTSTFFYWLDTKKTIAVRGIVLSNFTLDYERIIKAPFRTIAKQAAMAGGVYGERAKCMAQAVDLLRNRILQVLNAETVTADDKRLIDEFSAMLEQPAAHFHEGLQRILFFNQMLWQTRHTLNGLGRLDKILDDLYRQDLQSGYLKPNEAYGMILDFLTCLSKWYTFKSASLPGDIGQIIILGGEEPDGAYYCSDLTCLFMKAQAELGRPDPKVLLRVSDAMPKDLFETAMQCLARKTGSPLFSNDKVVIPYLMNFGIAEKDAYNYCVSACWEPFIPGRSLDQNNIKTFDFFRPLDTMLRTENLDAITSFAQLTEKYDASLQQEWLRFLYSLDEFVWAADPLVSMLTTGCTESGKDISEGGAVYSNYGVTTVGMGSVCDTLLNLKQLVFEDKAYTLAELDHQRRENYKATPETLAMLKNLPKHFAHDDSEAAALVNHILEISNRVVEQYKNPLGGRVKFGLSSPNYIKSAKHMMPARAASIFPSPGPRGKYGEKRTQQHSRTDAVCMTAIQSVRLFILKVVR